MRAGIFLVGFVTTAQAACPPEHAGSTMNWALEVCKHRSATDDALSPAVVACQKQLIAKDRIPPSPQQNCPLNAKYKASVCKALVQHGRYASHQACMQSVESIPRGVSQGIGGSM
ncbi:hypothetical protein WDZ92_42570 [Nostoc sp. NIES-2111]